MALHLDKSGVSPSMANRPCRPVAGCAIAAVLAKLAKHLAVLAALAILGQATGRFTVSQLSILLLIVAAALAHSVGQTLRLRWRKTIYPQRNLP